MKQKNKKYTLLTICFLTIFSLIFIFLFTTASAYSTDINYQFNTEIFLNENDIETNDSYNLRHPLIYTEIYNATFSFTNDDDGSTPNGWTDESTGTSGIQVYDYLGYHDKVLELNDTDASNYAAVKYDFTDSESGSIEFWFRTTDSTKDNEIRIYGNAGYAVTVFTSTSLLYVKDGASSVSTTETISNNVWYHIRIDFEAGSGAYMGLSSDTFYIYVNGIRHGDYDFVNPSTQLEYIYLFCLAGSGYKAYYDGIGFTIDEYQLGSNLIPYAIEDTDILEKDKTLFDLNNNVEFYEDYESDETSYNDWNLINTGDTDGNVHRVRIMPTTLYGNALEFGTDGSGGLETNDIGIEKDDFSSTSNDIFINITQFWDKIGLTSLSDYFFLKIFSYDSTLITNLRWEVAQNFQRLDLFYYNGASWSQLIDYYYFYHELVYLCIHLNYNTDTTTIIYYDDNYDLIYSFVIPHLSSDKCGLSEIQYYYETPDNTNENWIVRNYDIGVYDNVSSLTSDYGGIYSENIYNGTWNLNLYNLIDLTIDSELSFVNFLLGNKSENSIKIYDEYLSTDDYTIFANVYDEASYITNPSIFFFISNQSFEIDNSILFDIYIRGNSLRYDNTIQFLDYVNINVDNDESFFWVDSNNKLQFNLTSDDNNTEYIQAIIQVENTLTTDRFITFRANLAGNSYGSLQLTFLTTSDFISLQHIDLGYSNEITQDMTLDYFVIQITDNDEYYNGYTYGYISQLSLKYSTSIETTILILNLLSFLIPLIAIIAPSYIISESTKQQIMFVPLFWLITLVLTIASIIPYWILFIISLAFFMFIMTEKDSFENFEYDRSGSKNYDFNLKRKR